jgi:predicted phage terminase large subunit-like protein
VDGHYYIMDVTRFQKEWGDVVPAIAETMLQDGTNVMQGIEEVAFMSRAVTELNQDPRLHGFAIFGYPVDKDKVTRALPFAAKLAANNADQKVISVLDTWWTNDYLDEMCSFPNGMHDDQVDASSGAWAMIGSSSVLGELNYEPEQTYFGTY